jgi:hypothetical protein
MSSILLRPRLAAGCMILAVCAASRSFGDERTPADLLPRTTLALVELPRADEFLPAIEQHGLAKRLLDLAPVRAAMEKKEYVAFQGVVALLEVQMGLPWREVVRRGLGGGLGIAFDQETGGVVLLAKSTDGSTHAKFAEALNGLVALDAQNKGKDKPVAVSEYRGQKVYSVENVWVATAGDWLVATYGRESLDRIVDRILDEPDDSLAEDAQFAAARKAANPSAVIWSYVNTAAVRDAGMASQAFAERTENPLAEILLGGIVSTLRQTPYVTLDLALGDDSIQISAAAPHDRSWAGDLREHYFGPRGLGAAPPQLDVDDAILSVGAYRDISAMWLRAGELLDEQANEKLAKADSDLSTLFAGKDFGEDVLGAFGPTLRLVLTRQTFAEGRPAPAIKLPAFALAADLKDAAESQPELRRTFQSLIGFFNIVGAMNGQPQLELSMEKSDGLELVTASHLEDKEAADPRKLRLNYNFSPSVAFANGRFVLASTRELAVALATAPATKSATESTAATEDASRVANSRAELRFDALRATLADNREHLIAQNMLEKGHSRAEADQEIGILLDIAQWFDRLELQLDTTPESMQASANLVLQPADEHDPE